MLRRTARCLYISCLCRSVGERRRLEQDEDKMRTLLDAARPAANAGGSGAPSPELMAKLARCRRWLEAKTELCDPVLLQQAHALEESVRLNAMYKQLKMQAIAHKKAGRREGTNCVHCVMLHAWLVHVRDGPLACWQRPRRS